MDWAVAATLQSKLRGMGRLTSLTFASSLGFDEIGFVLGDKKEKRWRQREGDKQEEEEEKKKETGKDRGKGEKQGGKETTFLLPMKSLSLRPNYLDWPLR